jgi:CPA1 family monovalent cation:H+ antiporter
MPSICLSPGPERNTVLALTYCIVVFSILGQGLSVGKLVRWAVTGRG